MADAGNGSELNLSTAVIKAIRDETIAQVGKWTIGAFVVLFGIAASGWWFYLQKQVDDYIILKAGGVPKHAVIALDDPDTCAGLGSGWEDAGYGGRFMIGADRTRFGYGSHNDQLHTQVTLNSGNMPQVFLGYEGFLIGNNITKQTPTSIGFEQPTSGRFFTGGNATPNPIDIMPPYVALYFCRKKT